jgi:hypothetical protein
VRCSQTAAALERLGRNAEALDYAERVLVRYRTAGNRVGVARALNAIGWYRACRKTGQQIHR